MEFFYQRSSFFLFFSEFFYSSFSPRWTKNNNSDKAKKTVQKVRGRFRAVYFESGRTSLKEKKREFLFNIFTKINKPSFVSPTFFFLENPLSTLLRSFTTTMFVTLSEKNFRIFIVQRNKFLFLFTAQYRNVLELDVRLHLLRLLILVAIVELVHQRINIKTFWNQFDRCSKWNETVKWVLFLLFCSCAIRIIND